jgi:hypothetical protein
LKKHSGFSSSTAASNAYTSDCLFGSNYTPIAQDAQQSTTSHKTKLMNAMDDRNRKAGNGTLLKKGVFQCQVAVLFKTI